MKNTAIIAEYNPFHKGHKYQMDKIKSTNSNIVVIMSASFTQRGIPAVTDKFSRAKTAILCGADLVIELQGVFSTSNAEIFAKGAVGILHQTKIIDRLCFGSENNLEKLNHILDKIEENKYLSENLLKKNLSLGFAYPKAVEMSYEFLTTEEKQVLKMPNNILAMEYIKAIRELNSPIKPFSIERKHVNHNAEFAYKDFASSSYIRKNYLDENIKNYMPEESYHALKSNPVVFLNDFFKIIKYKILEDKIHYEKYMDYERGIENRFKKYINS
ncbi:MAG: nucleotidyltransferase family protein, partial [Peptoniphilus sp.]|nr:nucleotidyltransferase family protein [Peptoniphilus sp.]